MAFTAAVDPRIGLSDKLADIMAQVECNKRRPMTGILMHVLAETAEALQGVVARLKNDGYSFG